MSFLRSVFGPSKDEIWSQIAADIGGDFIDGGFWGRDALVYEHGEWTIVLDTYTVSTGKSSTTFTRMRAPFVNRDGRYFKIYREGFFSGMGRFFGMQDVEIGILKETALLRGLFDLFTHTLSRLVRIDSAYADDPNVRLR